MVAASAKAAPYIVLHQAGLDGVEVDVPAKARRASMNASASSKTLSSLAAASIDASRAVR